MVVESPKESVPIPDPSSLTTAQIDREVGHLRDILETRIDGLEGRLEERFVTQHTAMQTAFAAADKAVDKALDAAEKAVDRRQDTLDREFHEHLEQVRHENQLAFLNADKAVASALDAQKEAVHKAEVATEKRFESVNEFRAQLNDQANTFMPRTESIQMHARAAERIEELTDRMNRNEGKSSGYAALYGWIIAGIGLIISVVLFANAIFSKG